MINKTILEVLKASQQQLHKSLKTIDGIQTYPMYSIYSKGDPKVLKPMLCVHLDTINTCSLKVDKELQDSDFITTGGIVRVNPNSSLNCLGGDDRAGVWIALQLIKYMEETQDFKYDIGFFLDEEIGCIGSSSFITNTLDYNTSCYIGLDRRSSLGVHEVAIYGDDNTELIDIFESLDYKLEMGSITDAATLATQEIACVNLSVGYDFEHTKQEVLHLECMLYTLKVLQELQLESKEYPSDYLGSYYNSPSASLRYTEDVYEDHEILREFLFSMGYDPDDIIEEHYNVLGGILNV